MEDGVQISREGQILFERAAAETWLRIRHDQAKSSPRIKDMLCRLSENLYDNTLDVTRWKSMCNIHGNSIEQRFQQDLGCSPYQYLSSMRLETAARLLLEPRPKVVEIAALVGYKSLTVFSRAFQRWMGMRPSHYRTLLGSTARAKGRRARIGPWRQALLAPADSTHTVKRLRRFNEYYPPNKEYSTRALAPWCLDSERFERRRAERVWAGIKDRSHLEQIMLLRLEADFNTTALFDLLRDKSREEGRHSRRRGLEIAELGLLSLDLCVESLGEDLPNYEALGWISVANARRLMLDFIGSARDFETAAVRWQQGKNPDPLVEAELALYKGALRWYQMSPKTALALINRAVDLLKNLNKPALLAQSLILRAAVNKHQGSLSYASLDIKEALALVKKVGNPHLLSSAYTTYATTSIQLGKFEAAKEALLQAKKLCRRIDYEEGLLHICWTEGLCKQAEGTGDLGKYSLEKALSGFIQLGRFGQATIVRLDFAISCKLSQENERAVELASKTIPILEMLRYRREVLAVLKILNDSFADQKMSLSVLHTVRSAVADLLCDPTVRAALSKRGKREGTDISRAL